MALIRWTPFRSVLTMRDEMDRILDDFYGRMAPMGEGFEGDWCPSMDVAEADGKIVATVELPGLDKDDIKLSVHDDVLTVTGEKKQEKKETEHNVHRIERKYGYFKRSIALPSGVDSENVKATFKDGVLEVTLPKLESKKAKEIPIQVT
jgi:HSP20 family protein